MYKYHIFVPLVIILHAYISRSVYWTIMSAYADAVFISVGVSFLSLWSKDVKPRTENDSYLLFGV